MDQDERRAAPGSVESQGHRAQDRRVRPRSRRPFTGRRHPGCESVTGTHQGAGILGAWAELSPLRAQSHARPWSPTSRCSTASAAAASAPTSTRRPPTRRGPGAFEHHVIVPGQARAARGRPPRGARPPAGGVERLPDPAWGGLGEGHPAADPAGLRRAARPVLAPARHHADRALPGRGGRRGAPRVGGAQRRRAAGPGPPLPAAPPGRLPARVRARRCRDVGRRRRASTASRAATIPLRFGLHRAFRPAPAERGRAPALRRTALAREARRRPVCRRSPPPGATPGGGGRGRPRTRRPRGSRPAARGARSSSGHSSRAARTSRGSTGRPRAWSTRRRTRHSGSSSSRRRRAAPGSSPAPRRPRPGSTPGWSRPTRPRTCEALGGGDRARAFPKPGDAARAGALGRVPHLGAGLRGRARGVRQAAAMISAERASDLRARAHRMLAGSWREGHTPRRHPVRLHAARARSATATSGTGTRASTRSCGATSTRRGRATSCERCSGPVGSTASSRTRRSGTSRRAGGGRRSTRCTLARRSRHRPHPDADDRPRLGAGRGLESRRPRLPDGVARRVAAALRLARGAPRPRRRRADLDHPPGRVGPRRLARSTTPCSAG